MADGKPRNPKRAPLGWFGGKWFLVRDYALLDSSSIEAFKAFLAGGTAGVVSKTAVAPVERVKLLAQIEGLRACDMTRRSITHIAWDIWHLEGLQSFWKGNGPTVLRVIPNKGILFMCNDYFVALMSPATRETLLGRFVAGSLSGATSVTFTYPLEVIQSRMASGKHHGGIIDCLRSILSTEGFRSFYKGYSASLLGVLPYTGGQFFLYEGGKRWLQHVQAKTELSIWEKFVVGAISGKCAQAFSYPMDTVRRRLQVGTFFSQTYTSPWDCCKSIFRSEGVAGFYRGMSLNALRAMPSQGVQFAAYEVLKDLLSIRSSKSSSSPSCH
ncbi:Calcium-binding mitochondrial carrier protein SCaMC-1 (Small calcium-binding mitochondrial carrier protein 1) (Solute carrier family 25 member 24) [Durusdinium trenchii]|uniref:Calcium-binding mitochondrial carrier protein SCaMC-1 (Small calcium-binding mitochondrial carrier protein 1) (Solute carrier family 25 member 24) n=1 Tax=Durusdinium trenchii TaxID=1381693 RepID=A0ABP0I8S9_9DINO